MPRWSSLHLASLMGLLGSALIIIGLFLPYRFVTVVSPPASASFSTNSFWNMLLGSTIGNTITGCITCMLSKVGTEFFVLTILIPLFTSLAWLLGKRNRAILLLSLVFAILGFLEFLLISTLYIFLRLHISFKGSPSTPTDIHTAGPGYWLMLCGFSLCIVSSIIAGLLSSIPRPIVGNSQVDENIRSGVKDGTR